jgi:hypothetical protein
MKFFETSTGNLRASEAAGGVGHHVALSDVGGELCWKAATSVQKSLKRI